MLLKKTKFFLNKVCVSLLLMKNEKFNKFVEENLKARNSKSVDKKDDKKNDKKEKEKLKTEL